MYLIYQNSLCLEANVLYEEGFLSYYNYKNYKYANKLKIVRKGGNGRTALVDWESLPFELKDQIKEKIGNPQDYLRENGFMECLKIDTEAIDWYRAYQLEESKFLPMERQREYVANASVMNAVREYTNKVKSKRVSMSGNARLNIWNEILEVVKRLPSSSYPHTLPTNEIRFRQRYNNYLKDGYAVFVHRNFSNQNKIKIKGELANYLIGKYALPNKLSVQEVYLQYLKDKKDHWAEVTDRAIGVFLNKPENKRIWYIGRHGEAEYKNSFARKSKRSKINHFPNCYWAIDGSKLDWMHQDDSTTLKMASKLKYDVVVDVFSEKIIGWAITEKENFESHFTAIKMAANVSGSRPYLMTYDNQGGHITKPMQQLYSSLVAKNKGTHYPHKARFHSNPIEQIFSRFQTQVLNKKWYSDKQGIKSKKTDSHPNIEFILKNKEKLKTKEQLVREFALCVDLWNASKHPNFEKTRNEMYNQPQLYHEKLEIVDMIELFWIETKREVTYTKDGLRLRVGDMEYWYEVHNGDALDIEFRRTNIGAKFIVKYDPEYLGEFVQLYRQTNNGLQYVASATPKQEVEVVPILMDDDEKTKINTLAIYKTERERDLQKLNNIRQNTNTTDEDLINQQETLSKFGGHLPKELAEACDGDNFLIKQR